MVAPRPRPLDTAHGDEGVLRCVEELLRLVLSLHATDVAPLRGLERSFGQDGFATPRDALFVCSMRRRVRIYAIRYW